MIALDRRTRIFATSLSALAGYVDAIGFIATGGYFLSFMSGNSTRMAVGFEQAPALALAPLGLVLCFVIGVVLGSAVGDRAGRWRSRAVLGLVGLLLALAAALFPAGMVLAAFALTAMAMGAENTALVENGEVRVGLTYMTGTLVKLGQRLFSALSGGALWDWVPYLGLWCGLAGGAVIGAFAFAAWGMIALAAAAAMAFLLAALARPSD